MQNPEYPSPKKLRGVKGVAATVAMSLFVTPIAACDLTGGTNIPSQPSACNTLETSLIKHHPVLEDELLCFYPELTAEKVQTIPVSADTTIFNGSDAKINLAAAKSTIRFFRNLFNYDLNHPVFLHEKATPDSLATYPIPDSHIQGSILQDNSSVLHAFFLAPPQDSSNIPIFVESKTDNTFVNDTEAYTFPDTTIGEKGDVEVTPSYVFDGDEDDSGDTLSEFDIEACQSFVATVTQSEPDNANIEADQSTLQEDTCNTLGGALADVQKGMSESDFDTTYVNSSGQYLGMVNDEGNKITGRLIPLKNYMYRQMTKVRAAIAA